MKEPQGELVELDFYFRHSGRVDSFSRVVKYCCEHGGSFAGTILETAGTSARRHQFTHLYERSVSERSIDVEELERKLENNDTDVLKVAIWSAIGITHSVPEIVTYSPVSSAASEVDNPAVAILSEGWVFSTPGYERQARRAGRRCYQRFVEICAALDPDYAAILNEDSLPCRYDLARTQDTRCFTSFFVSQRAYDANTIKSIEGLYHDAYTERISTGLYVSSWSMYNPRKVTIDSTITFARSTRIAEMLGTMAR